MKRHKDIRDRLDTVEAKIKAQEARRDPADLFGRYYDELSQADKWRWWHYVYAGVIPFKTLEEYERFEMDQMDLDSLHFKCFSIPSLSDITDIKELEIESIKMGRRDWI